jgi:hypothetical protein
MHLEFLTLTIPVNMKSVEVLEDALLCYIEGVVGETITLNPKLNSPESEWQYSMNPDEISQSIGDIHTATNLLRAISKERERALSEVKTINH